MPTELVWIVAISSFSCFLPLLVLTCLHRHERAAGRGRRRLGFESCYFAIFFVVASITVVSMVAQQGSWILGGVSLACMAVGATLPHSPQRPFEAPGQ